VILHATNDSLSRRLVPALERLSVRTGRRLTISYKGDAPWSSEAVRALLKTIRRHR